MQERPVGSTPFQVGRQHLSPPDRDLVNKIQKGDQDAWEAFLQRHTDVIYAKALEYSRAAQAWLGAADWEDEVGSLYLFMALSVQRSLKSFRGGCSPSTWVLTVIKNRRQVLKAYLLHKDPARAEVRPPRVLPSRKIDREIFRRLVWGLSPAWIAHELNVHEDQCREVEDLLADRSPRVYERIVANRHARQPKVSIDATEDTASDDVMPNLQIVSRDADPEQLMAQRELANAVEAALADALESMPLAEQRVLILIYEHELTVAQIVDLAAKDENLGLGEAPNVNRVYYLKDKALRSILDRVVVQLEDLHERAAIPASDHRRMLNVVEDLLREWGIPKQRK